MKCIKRQNGFTLLETLIVLAIIAIVASMGIPSASGYIDNNRLSAGAVDLAVAIQTARAEAVGRNLPVALCVSDANGDDCAADAHWEDGWLIFVDENNDGDVDTGEAVIQYHNALTGKVTFRGTSAFDGTLTFFPSGRTSISATQTLVLCDERGFGADAKALVVSMLGRASIMAAPSTGVNSCDI